MDITKMVRNLRRRKNSEQIGMIVSHIGIVRGTSLDGKKVERQRRWDSCTFREYSMVAEGHNFREARSERLKLRFTHKLQAFVGKFGEPACVGCGRCINTCPVDIDIRTVGMRLKGEEVMA